MNKASSEISDNDGMHEINGQTILRHYPSHLEGNKPD